MKKKMHVIAVLIAACLLFAGFAARPWTQRQETAHEIAEMARGMGLPEDDPIIRRASEIWWEDENSAGDDSLPSGTDERAGTETRPYAEAEGPEAAPEDEKPTAWWTQQDVDIIASVIFNEAGYGTTARHKELVAAVVVNRVMDSRFPGSVYEVVVQPYQYYAPYAQYGSYYMNRAMQSGIWADCCEIAERALRGEIECPGNVLFQANFPQGTGTYELGYTSYSVTYFCYG